MPRTGTVERVSELEVLFEWRIKNFSELPDQLGYSCYSPDFEFHGRTWYLHLVPNGEEGQSEGCVGLYLCSPRRGDPLEVRYSLRIRPGLEETMTASFGEGEAGWGTEDMVKRSELMRRREEFLPRDVLDITATLRAKPPGGGTKDASVQTTQVRDDDETEEEKTGSEKVLQDIAKMWPGGDHCDVVFRVGNTEFEAHRAILAARTPVLGAMFLHDTSEKASGTVTIEDCEPAVFEQLLYYIYKGAPRELTAENASSLYVVADKYLVSEVKKLCVRCMRDTLSLDTFCDSVTISLIHGEDELLDTAVRFFAKHMVQVLQTIQWQLFLRDHSTWANEILIRAAKIGQEGRRT